MSGIAGILNLDQRPADPTVIARLTAAMAHRGPDGAGHWVDGPVALGHRLHRTTPESRLESQPLLDETGDLCLTFDGRVDNPEDLRREIEAEGVPLRDSTDAELALKAYVRWGEECLSRLLGDFALAIWDRRCRKLFCARDPLGTKPFYYHLSDRTFVFASEMQPLFEHPSLERRPNLAAAGLYLLGGYDNREETLYQGVRRLPSAHCLSLAGGSPRQKQYWDIDSGRAVRCRDDAEYAEQFLALFREAVRVRLRNPSGTGVVLSGGLDSSSITSVAAMLRREGAVPDRPFEAFSVGYDRFPCDERSYSSEVARKWNVPWNAFVHDQQDPSLFSFDNAARYPDVLYHPIIYGFIPVYRDMHNRGFSVFLDGIGGDELLEADYDYLTDMMAGGHFLRLARQIKLDAAYYHRSPRKLFVDHCVRPLVPKAVKAALRPLRKRVLGDGNLFMRPEFVAGERLMERIEAAQPPRKMPTRSQQAIYDRLFYGWNANAGIPMIEAFAAQFSLEIRRPFLDRRVVEFMLAVPADQGWRPGLGMGSKTILRNAMKGILPEKVRTRTEEAEFSGPVDFELRERRASELQEIFRTSTLAAAGMFDRNRLLDTFERYQAGGLNHLTSPVELALQLELWHRAATTGRESSVCAQELPTRGS
ncbi:MAG TPA: asparagine synthase (glutamine-hydrolyzing) [Terriglobia bacterium]|nr:asparagine synthase (glutamine-hydrolyzing) [Terriglobia bacterium]